MSLPHHEELWARPIYLQSDEKSCGSHHPDHGSEKQDAVKVERKPNHNNAVNDDPKADIDDNVEMEQKKVIVPAGNAQVTFIEFWTFPLNSSSSRCSIRQFNVCLNVV